MHAKALCIAINYNYATFWKKNVKWGDLMYYDQGCTIDLSKPDLIMRAVGQKLMKKVLFMKDWLALILWLDDHLTD